MFRNADPMISAALVSMSSASSATVRNSLTRTVRASAATMLGRPFLRGDTFLLGRGNAGLALPALLAAALDFGHDPLDVLPGLVTVGPPPALAALAFLLSATVRGVTLPPGCGPFHPAPRSPPVQACFRREPPRPEHLPVPGPASLPAARAWAEARAWSPRWRVRSRRAGPGPPPAERRIHPPSRSGIPGIAAAGSAGGDGDSPGDVSGTVPSGARAAVSTGVSCTDGAGAASGTGASAAVSSSRASAGPGSAATDTASGGASAGASRPSSSGRTVAHRRPGRSVRNLLRRDRWRDAPTPASATRRLVGLDGGPHDVRGLAPARPAFALEPGTNPGHVGVPDERVGMADSHARLSQEPE